MQPAREYGNRLLAAVALALALLAPASVAEAETESQRLDALRELKEGNRLFDSGDYLGALTRFERAYARVPSPKLLFNLGQTHRKLGHPVEALELYERFLAEAPDASPKLRQEAQRWASELEKSVATVDVRAPEAGAEVSVDGRSCGLTPLPRVVRVAPGPHQVVVQARGGGLAPYVERIVTTAGQRLTLSARFQGQGAAAGASAPTAAGASAPTAAGPGARTSAADGGDALARPDLSTAPPSGAGDVQAVAAPAASDGGHRGRLALLARADIDRQLAGAGALGAVGYGVAEQLELFAGGFVWPASGLYVPGVTAGLIGYALGGTLRPFATVEAQAYFRSGAHAGAHAALGVGWDLGRHAGAFAEAGVEYTSSTIVAGERTLFFVPSVGLLVRL